jgi:outer membrane pore protein E
MKSEEHLDRLFAYLKSEEVSTSPDEISIWLESATVINPSPKGSGFTQIKARLSAKIRWVIFPILLVATGVIWYLISDSPTQKQPEKKIPSSKLVSQSILKNDSIEIIANKEEISNLKSNEQGKGAASDISINDLTPTLLIPVDFQPANALQGAGPLSSLNEEKKWAGVYRSFAEFNNGKFYDSIDLDIRKHKIYVSSFDRLIVKTESRKTVYKPGTVYGYFDGKNLRRYGETNSVLKDFGYFTVQDTNGLILYKQIQTGYKGTQHTSFFYSTTLNSPIKKLSVKNLNLDFPNHQFVSDVRKNVENLTNMRPEKSQIALSEINAAFRKYY